MFLTRESVGLFLVRKTTKRRKQLGFYILDFQELHKRLVPRVILHYQRKLFVNRSLRDQLACVEDFSRVFHFSSLSLSKRSFRVCPPTLFAAVLNFFLPLITCGFLGAASCNNAAPTRFASGTTYVRKRGLAVLISCESALHCLPRRLKPLKSEASTCLELTIFLCFHR